MNLFCINLYNPFSSDKAPQKGNSAASLSFNIIIFFRLPNGGDLQAKHETSDDEKNSAFKLNPDFPLGGLQMSFLH